MTRVAAIIGHPLGHSLSPVFQQAAFEAAGLDAAYERWETPPEALGETIGRLRERDCLGANVTIPYKEAAIAHVDELDRQAARVGAINTIVNRGGLLAGFNTDGPGLLRALREERALEPRGLSFLILGAGGAARGIAFALLEAGAGALAIWNRTRARAERLASDLAAAGAPARVEAAVTAGPLSRFDCIVNCTSAGMAGGGAEGSLPLDPAGAAPGTLVVDIVYAPPETPFLRAAAAAGLPTLGGLPMLIHQGALSFELWVGEKAPLQVMLEAAERALAGGSTRPEGSR